MDRNRDKSSEVVRRVCDGGGGGKGVREMRGVTWKSRPTATDALPIAFATLKKSNPGR